MNELKEKFGRLQTEISMQRGAFTLFLLLLREDSPNRWDLIVSAPWADKDKDAAVKFLVAEIKARLAPEDLISLSRIVIADSGDKMVQAMTRAFSIDGGGTVEVQNSDIFGLPIDHAYIFASKQPEVSVQP
jgi:hypothetical protein